MTTRSGEKIYGYRLAGAVAVFVADNKGCTARYLIEHAFRYLKSAHGADTLVTGAGNFNRELNYLALDGISDYKKGMKDMSEQQDERQRDPLEDHITITADARGPLTVQILFTRAELRYLLIMLMASHDGSSYDRDEELEHSTRIK